MEVPQPHVIVIVSPKQSDLCRNTDNMKDVIKQVQDQI